MNGKGAGERGSEGMTLIELSVAMGIFLVIIGVTYGGLGLVQQNTDNNILGLQSTETAMAAMNEIALEVRDISNSYDNSVQLGDNGLPDIVTMNATELEFLSGNNVVNNDFASTTDGNGGGSFTTGCANEIDIKLSGTALVQTDIAPTISAGECTWPSSPAPASVTLLSNIEPLCSGSACSSSTSGASIFTYWEQYPSSTTVPPGSTTDVSAVAEITIGFAVLPAGKVAGDTVLSQTVRLGAVLSDPSSDTTTTTAATTTTT